MLLLPHRFLWIVLALWAQLSSSAVANTLCATVRIAASGPPSFLTNEPQPTRPRLEPLPDSFLPEVKALVQKELSQPPETARLDPREWFQFQTAIQTSEAGRALPHEWVSQFARSLFEPQRGGRLLSREDITAGLQRFRSNLATHEAKISLNGRELPSALDPLKRAFWMREKFPQLDQNAVFDNTKSFFVAFQNPEQVLSDAKVSKALSILSRYTRSRDGIPADQIGARSADERMSLWLPAETISHLKSLGVTAAEYRRDNEGNKLVLSFHSDRIVGYDAVIGGLRPGETSALKASDTGFTAAPSTRATAQPTSDFSLMLATRADGTVELRDMFAGAFAESGPPTLIAEILFEGKHLTRPEPNQLPPRNQREKVWKSRVAQALERFDLDVEAWRKYSEDPNQNPKPPPETQYAQFWSKQALTDAINFWSNHARANGRSVGAEPGATQVSIPPNVHTFPTPIQIASRVAPFLPERTRLHIGHGEIVVDSSGKTKVEGMHLFEHYTKALERGDRARPEDRPDLIYRLEKTDLMTVDETGKRVKDKDDNAKNLKGLVANLNPDGVTYSVRMSMDGPDGAPLPFKPCTLFPPKWKMEHVDAAAQMLMATESIATGPSGTRSYFSYFPSDPSRPISSSNPKFSVQMFVGPEGQVYTVFSSGTFQPVEVQ